MVIAVIALVAIAAALAVTDGTSNTRVGASFGTISVTQVIATSTPVRYW
jgi:hypothetical protein